MDSIENSNIPQDSLARRRWVTRLRREVTKNPITDSTLSNAFIEVEPEDTGTSRECVTVLVQGRQCAWRCVHCDLWKHASDHGANGTNVGRQILNSLKAHLLPGRWAKIYNAGSFFDRAAVPSSVVSEAVPLLRGYEKVIVESHPGFVGESIWRFRDAIRPARLQIAMGLETAHPQTLLALNKGFSVEEFGTAAEQLRANGIELRSFLLVRPPFLDRPTGLEWVKRSVDFSFDVGASVVSLILTRLGNGALDVLEKSGQFIAPNLAELQESLAYGLSRNRGIVLADLWGLERLRRFEPEFDAVMKRLACMNSEQRLINTVSSTAI